jgi:hypothetical protein
MDNITITASGGGKNTGVSNSNSSPTMSNIIITASDGNEN